MKKKTQRILREEMKSWMMKSRYVPQKKTQNVKVSILSQINLFHAILMKIPIIF